jgi:hypothetical protein
MRMFLSVTGRRWGWLRLTACYLSILLVLSFICFEVLDLDGSDFSHPAKTPGIKVAESQDLRRPALAGVRPLASPALTTLDERRSRPKFEASRAGRAVVARVTPPRSPLTLPRAALDDLPA